MGVTYCDGGVREGREVQQAIVGASELVNFILRKKQNYNCMYSTCTNTKNTFP